MKRIIYKLSPLAPLVTLYIIFLCLRPSVFGNLSNILLILQNAVIPCLLAWALSLNFLMGIIDFSMGAEMILMTIISVFFSRTLGVAGIILGALAAGVVTGGFKTFIFNVTKANTMVLSIALTILFGALTTYLTTGQSLVVSQDLLTLGKPLWTIIFFICLMLIFYIVNKYSSFASKVRAYGGSPVIATTVGINTVRIKAGTIFFGTFFCAVAAILSVSRGSGASITTGLDSIQIVFSALMAFFIAAPYIDRLDLTFGIIIGSLCFSVLNVGLISINLPSNYNNTIIGAGLLILLTITGINDRKKKEKLYRETCLNRRN